MINLLCFVYFDNMMNYALLKTTVWTAICEILLHFKINVSVLNCTNTKTEFVSLLQSSEIILICWFDVLKHVLLLSMLHLFQDSLISESFLVWNYFVIL